MLNVNKIYDKINPDVVSGCWNFTGALHNGYGRLKIDGRRYYLHRLTYEYFIGRIPDGLSLDHLCRNRACCNPAHLEPVTTRVNVLRGIGVAYVNANKTHCDKGHILRGENLYVCPKGKRNCRICRREARRKSQGYYDKNR